MPISDVLAIANSMGIDVPNTTSASQVVQSFEHHSTVYQQLDTAGDNENENSESEMETGYHNELDEAFVRDQSMTQQPMNISSLPVPTGDGDADAPSADAEEAPAASSAAAGDDNDNQYDEIISSFCDITGSDPANARYFLEVSEINYKIIFSFCFVVDLIKICTHITLFLGIWVGPRGRHSHVPRELGQHWWW